MERALYEPGLGYYARRQNVTGRKGDFITSVSVGPCFGQLLAEQVADYWDVIGRPEEFHLVEQGANDGRLMADVVQWLEQQHATCAAAVVVHLIEPLESAREEQRRHLPQVHHHAVGEALKFKQGMLFCNELLDAFPVQRVRWDGECWRELGVGVGDDGGFHEVTLDPVLSLAIPTAELPPGYTTEYCLEVERWLQQTSAWFEQGLWLVVDYGLHAEEYFAPWRTEGTLRGYSRHRMVTKDFLATPGLMDLTAHVNWTEVLAAGAALGLQVTGPVAQLRFLTALAEPVLKNMEKAGSMSPEDRGWLRQFQTLTNPSQMGSKFQAVLLSKGVLRRALLGAKYGR